MFLNSQFDSMSLKILMIKYEIKFEFQFLSNSEERQKTQNSVNTEEGKIQSPRRD